MYPLASTNDFAITFRCDHIYSQRKVGALLIRLEIERLESSRVAINHYGAIEVLRKQRLVCVAEIASPLNLTALRLQELHGIVVIHAREWRFYGLKLGGIALQDFPLFPAALQHPS